MQITGLAEDTTYYYVIPAANGTTQSEVLSFITGRNAGTAGEFSAILLNDMGYVKTFTERNWMVKYEANLCHLPVTQMLRVHTST